LRELWTSQPTRGATDLGELLALVQARTGRFDRMIIMRNLIECAAALSVAVFFAHYALVRAQNAVSRLGGWLVAAGAIWIISYVVRHGQGPATLDPSQDVSSYTSALRARYDHQIRLLKSVKYWYLLPLYVGLSVANAGALLERRHPWAFDWRDLAGPVFYTAVFAVVWWLNEIYAVGRLERERARLLSITARTTDLSGRAE
jgi:hypothetical protein